METPYVDEGLVSVTSADGTLRVERIVHLVDDNCTISELAEPMPVKNGETIRFSLPYTCT